MSHTVGIDAFTPIDSHEANKFVVACISGSWISDYTLCIIQICWTALTRFVRPTSVVIQTVPVEISTLMAVSYTKRRETAKKIKKVK